jgi:hypothetical protein
MVIVYGIACELEGVEPGVGPALGEQSGVRAHLRDSSVLQYHDSISAHSKAASCQPQYGFM